MQLNKYIPGVPASKRAAVQFVSAVLQCGTCGKTCVWVWVCMGMGSGCAVWRPIPIPMHIPTHAPADVAAPVKMSVRVMANAIAHALLSYLQTTLLFIYSWAFIL